MSKFSELCARDVALQKEIEKKGERLLGAVMDGIVKQISARTGIPARDIPAESEWGTFSERSRWATSETELARVVIGVRLDDKTLEALKLRPDFHNYGCVIVGLSQEFRNGPGDYFIGAAMSEDTWYAYGSDWDMKFPVDTKPEEMAEKFVSLISEDREIHKHGSAKAKGPK